MSIKCIALDLDRTTLNAEGRLSPGNRAALEQAIEKGIHIIIASGRSFHTLPSDIKNFPGIEYAVTGNGAAMYHVPTGKCLHKHLLEEEDVSAIMKETENDPVTYEAFIEGTAFAGREFLADPGAFGATPQFVEYVKATRHLKEDIVSFIKENRDRLDSLGIIVNDENRKRDIWKRIEQCAGEVYITSSIKRLIEISHKNSGKHTGTAFFTDLLGVKREEVAAFGDADNDVDMLLHVGCGIAMENSSRKCKEAADHMTRHHDEDGVAYGMREILHVID